MKFLRLAPKLRVKPSRLSEVLLTTRKGSYLLDDAGCGAELGSCEREPRTLLCCVARDMEDARKLLYLFVLTRRHSSSVSDDARAWTGFAPDPV